MKKIETQPQKIKNKKGNQKKKEKDSLNKNKRGKRERHSLHKNKKEFKKKGERHILNKNKKQIKKKIDTVSKRIKGRVKFQQSCRKKHRTQSFHIHICCG
jgi:hypothetical protein